MIVDGLNQVKRGEDGGAVGAQALKAWGREGGDPWRRAISNPSHGFQPLVEPPTALPPWLRGAALR